MNPPDAASIGARAFTWLSEYRTSPGAEAFDFRIAVGGVRRYGGSVHRRARRFGPTFPDFSSVVQTSRERLQVVATHAELEGLSVHRAVFSAGFQLRVNVSPGRAVLAFAEGAARLSSHGRDWPPAAFALAGASGIDVFSLEPANVGWIEFAPERPGIAASLRAALAGDRGGEFAVCEETLAACLRSTVRGSGGSPRAALDGVLASARRLPQRAAVSRRYQLVLDAEDFMAEHLGEGPPLEALGAQLGCSPRTIIYAFTQLFGIGPMAYFKLQRLNAIHRRLSAGSDAPKISELAPRYGFRHMGHFSTDYRLMFGQPPSRSRSARDEAGRSSPA